MPAPRSARRLSLEIKLPLAVSALLVLVMGLYAWIAYQEVAQASLSATSERNARLAADLAQLTATSSAARARLVARVANRPEVQREFASYTFARAENHLDSLRLPTDSTFVLVFFDAQGRAAHFGKGMPGPEVMSRVEPLLARAHEADTLAVSSPLFEYNGRAYTWSVAAVKRAQEKLGYVAQLRRVQTNAAAARALQSLIGQNNRILFANTDQMRDTWIELGGTMVPAPDEEVEDAQGWRYQRNGIWYIAGKKPIAGTPWQMIVEAPESGAQTRPREFLRRTGLVGLLLLLAATALVWFASRRITRPIRQLRDAAGEIERGHLDKRVEIRRADELGELGGSFNQMAAEVQRSMLAVQESRAEAQLANKSKSEFLANMSHEIRTPINAILGYTDIIQQGIAGEVNDAQRKHLERIRVSGNHLVGLIDDLLDFARLDVARMNVQQEVAHASESIRTAVTVVAPQAAAKRIDLQVTCAPDIRYLGDPQRVEQILVNLLGNALKFTRPDGTVTLDCALTRSDGNNEVRFTVTDTGIGIPADRLEAIFEPFVQARGGYTRPHGGTGLGLSISRRLADLMGGTITVESEIDVGSRFTLAIPAEPDG